MFKLVAAFAKALDLSNLKILNHSERVAYIVLKLTQALGLTQTERADAVLAALVHDIGISSSHWRLESHHLHLPTDLINDHCRIGGELLSKVAPLAHLADAVICHHDRWDGLERIPIAARLIHLADRIEVQISPGSYILAQARTITDQIADMSAEFWPEAIRAFSEVGRGESFWLDLATGHYRAELTEFIEATEVPKPILPEIADLFATVIDRKSPFTATHSHGVARTARFLAIQVGMTPEHVSDMEIAGLLHDLGKLAVPDEVLEYPGRLSSEQMLLVKQHTYHTYYLLSALSEHPHIKEWAAFHHEKLNGTGYPFRLSAADLSLGARIMAVADIFQALHEDRPYRKGLSLSEIKPIMSGMVARSEIDRDLTDLLLDTYPSENSLT